MHLQAMNFKIQERIDQFIIRIKTLQIDKKLFLYSLSGWIVTFYWFFYAPSFPFSVNLWWLLLCINVYFWFKLLKLIQDYLKPPSELLIAFYLILLFIELTLLNIYGNYDLKLLAFPVNLLQNILILLLVLLFSLLLVENSPRRKSTIFWFLLLGYFGLIVVTKSHSFIYLLLYQFFLFIFLLKKTKWLEELTQIECWAAFLMVFVLTRKLFNIEIFESNHFKNSLLWYGVPKILYLIARIYLLAVLVKIPVVLIYNHARLSRKLWISSILQSTFPQAIQFILLLIIFYFFIAGWQAQNLRENIISIPNKITQENLKQTVIIEDSNNPITLFDSYTIEYHQILPSFGVIQLNSEMEHEQKQKDDFMNFILFARSETFPDTAVFIPVNDKLLKLLTSDLPVVTGSRLVAYSYKPQKWEDWVYRTTFWVEKHDVRIFPFALVSESGEDLISTSLSKESAQTSKLKIRFMNQEQLVSGRVLLPLFDRTMHQKGYFALDIVLVPSVAFFKSATFRYAIYLLVVYFVINVLLIRRMVSLGTEINQMIVHKFRHLQRGIREIAAGNLDYKVRLEGQDEFVELAEHFNQMGNQLKKTIENLREKDRLEHELKIAKEVQLSILPKTLPSIPDFEIVAKMQTANEVGGDFYDVLSLEDNMFLLAIGDVSGKGTSAAFYMAQCVSLIRYSRQFTSDPREIMLRLNHYFSTSQVNPQIFVTAILGALNAKESTIKILRCGHTFPILISSGISQEIQTKGLGIGLARQGKIFEQNLEIKEFKLNSGDTLIFYTDGLVEASRQLTGYGEDTATLEFYGEERLFNLLASFSDKPAEVILETLLDDIETFYAGNPRVDDYTLVVIKKN